MEINIVDWLFNKNSNEYLANLEFNDIESVAKDVDTLATEINSVMVAYQSNMQLSEGYMNMLLDASEAYFDKIRIWALGNMGRRTDYKLLKRLTNNVLYRCSDMCDKIYTFKLLNKINNKNREVA